MDEFLWFVLILILSLLGFLVGVTLVAHFEQQDCIYNLTEHENE